MKTQEKKAIKKLINGRLDTLKGNELFNDQAVNRIKYETDFYICDDNDHNVGICVSVISPDLIVTNAVYMNNTDEIEVVDCPTTIGTNNSLRGNRIFVYSVASSIKDNTAYTLHVTLTDGTVNKAYSVSMVLNKGETGEIVQQINFI
ncbi:hypothetical protein [uncultured Chryseobacterium sp.]|uniref:hypothetical protein n=1 Tax=uncultured Chryseobacterium sp. TaxID=259322 RepID=UPI002586D6B7|nr:hypothetical protein [uncultured Chryseobacterium sp.]